MDMSSFLYYIITVPFSSSIDDYTASVYENDDSLIINDIGYLKVLLNYNYIGYNYYSL